MNIVLLESLGISDEMLNNYAKALETSGHHLAAYPKDTNPAVQIERAKDADIVVIANMPLSGEVISACPKLKFIDVAFTGVDHVDLKTAKAQNIAVSNAAGYSTQAVAELSVGMMLSLLRHVPEVDKRCRNGGTKDGLVGSELGGKTVGIVGTGAIGIRTAEICRAFGCRVLGYQRHKVENSFIEYVPLETLLAESDIVSLHCPLNDSTKHMINQERIALMKPSAILINVARGPVVDSAALAEALNNGSIAGAGIDVFEDEPPLDEAHPLLHSKNTLVTPHIAFATKESMSIRANIVFGNINAWLAGKQKNVVL
jgi:Lactate dehydrogenase and related dehydrogenases